MSTTIKPSTNLQIIRKGKEAEFAVLPWLEYQALMERLEDLEDLVAIREARAEDDGTRLSHEEVCRELGLDPG